MKDSMKILLILILLTGTALAQAVPQWITVGKESGVFTMAKGTVVRWGSPASIYAADYGTHKIGDASAEAWTAPKTLDADTTFTANVGFFGSDPVYGVYKVVQVLQTTAAQTVHYLPPDGSGAVDVPVPALPPTNQPGAVITSGAWADNSLPCWRQEVKAKNPDGSDGKSYYLEICGPID